MSHILHYGSGERVELARSAAGSVLNYSEPVGVPLTDPQAAVTRALSQPLAFPPLTHATVPGDRIVMAVDRSVPRVREVVAAIVTTLLAGRASPEEITILVSGERSDLGDLIELVPPEVQGALQLVWHDPEETNAMTYLASSREGHRICFNRRLLDADFVLPVGTLRLSESWGYFGVHGGLFPAFSDGATIRRFQACGPTQWEVHQRRRREEVDEAAWLLGVQFTVQLAPGRGDDLLDVIAGESRAVASRGHDVCAQAWLHPIPQRTELVVAAIEGGTEQQTWENFARALYSASQAVRPGGAIVLCTDLRLAPGPAMRQLAAGADDELLLREIRRANSPDAVSALLLADALHQTHVYLLSGLDQETVEELGLGYVADPAEVSRLCQRVDSCILLGNAHRAILRVQEL